MSALAKRVARRFLATRPIPIDKKYVATFVDGELVPGIVRWLKRHPKQDEPIGAVGRITDAVLSVDEADGRQSHSVTVTVGSVPAKGKFASVLSGASRKGEIDLHMNGALSPQEYLAESGMTVRIQPVWSCRYETCLPYGLYSLLIHELTHSADVFRGPLRYSPSEVLEKGEAAYGTYLNDPAEVRAFMQQVVDEAVSSMTRNDTLREHAQKKPNPNQALVDLALRMSTTWKIVEKHLDRRNRDKILKAVYDGLDQAGLLL
jgi:hypothetical protein